MELGQGLAQLSLKTRPWFQAGTDATTPAPDDGALIEYRGGRVAKVLEVDRHGFVVDYPDLAHRIPSPAV